MIGEYFCKAIPRGKRGLLISLIGGLLLISSSCDKKSNEHKSEGAKGESSAIAGDSLAKPRISVDVNKRYDEKGNLIGFDSTYSSFYSNFKGDTVKWDSLVKSFDRYFSGNHSSFFDNQMNTLFFNDSLRYPDFFNRDFFMKRYELNDEYLRGMMHRMDSIKNDFFREHSRREKDLTSSDIVVHK